MSIITRNSMVSASSTSSSTQTQRSENRHPQFEVWSLIRRRSNENPFCMEAKFRAGKRLHRIRNTIVTRRRKHVDSEVEADDEASATSSTDSSDDWLNSDDEEDDFFDIFDRLNHMNNKKRDLKTIATMLISQRKQQQVQQTVPKQRPASGDMFVLEELTFTGSNAQKLYLKKCADFQITPCSHFVKSLSSKEIDMEHHNVGPKGAVACAFALTKATTVRTVNMNDIGMGPRGAKYIALMLRENQKITDLNISDNCIGVKGAKYLTDVIIDVDKLYRLDLSGNDFMERDAEVIKLLMEEARNLKYLNLSHNEFRESGGELIGEALNWNDGLEELDISWNHLRRRGSIGIAEGLQDNSSLRILNLSWNGFYLEGCRALVRTLQLNTTLEVLDLSNNRINRECLGHLVKGLAKNTTLHTLILRFNPLTSDGAYDILKFIHDCPTSGIETLDLGVQQVDPDFITLYKEILIQKRTLDVIYGQVVGHSLLNYDEIERRILDENPSIVLLEFGKLMGFRLLDLFSTLDKDGSRTLDRDEIERGLRIANIPMSEHCLDLLIQKLDTNGDGEIDFAELMQAKQEYRKLHMKLLQAQEGQGDIKLEETSLWRIKSMLLKLMAEKVVDYPSFQRSTNMLIKQIRAKTAEKDAREETQAKIRASQPRKVKSRPTSSVRPSPIDMHVLSASSPEHSDDDVILTPELTTRNDEEKAIQSVRKSNVMRRNFSVQLPLTDLERILNRQNLTERTTSDFEVKEEPFGAGATSDERNGNESKVGEVSKAPAAKDNILDVILQSKEKNKSKLPKGKGNTMSTKAGSKEFSSSKYTPKKTFSKEQQKLKERVVNCPPDGRSRTDKGLSQPKKETRSPERLIEQSRKRKSVTETQLKSSEAQNKDKLKIPVDATTFNPKATMYPEKTVSESQHTKSGI